MKISIIATALTILAGANAQSTSTVLAACGTACPTGPAPDVTVTRSNPPVPTGTPCPSLIVSSMAGNMSSPTMPGAPSPSAFTGGANHLAISLGAVIAAGSFLLTL
ncbi:MAG: hypothetical protein Q9190_001237 [Brigantiaea leucoxantha]